MYQRAMKRYPSYQSTSAGLSRRLGALAIPTLVVSVLAQRAGLIDPTIMGAGLLTGAALGVCAALAALFAFARLWRRGGKGTSAALTGFSLGGLALAPLVAFGVGLVVFPSLPDVSTDLQNPPSLEAGLGLEPGNSRMPEAVWSIGGSEKPAADIAGLVQRLSGGADRGQRDLLPDIVSRRFRAQPAQIHSAALRVAERNGWTVTYELPPDLADTATKFQAVAQSAILGLEEDVVVRIQPDPVGSLLDVRSVSRFALPGLSNNADRIRKIMTDLDQVLLETYGDLERVVVQDDPLDAGLDTGPLPVPENDAPARTPVPAFKPFFEGADEPVAEGDTLDNISG